MSLKVCLIGTGNVAWHLANAFHQVGIKVIEIYGRDENTTIELSNSINCNYVTDLNKITRQADIYLICINDDNIAEVAYDLKHCLPNNVTITHTSGSLSNDILKTIFVNYGVFWPLQTLTKGINTDWSQIPIMITSSNKKVELQLTQLAGSISNNVSVINDNKRSKLHLAAVIANNFSNHIYSLLEEYCKSTDLNFKDLIPLISETSNKLKMYSPSIIQTGPAIRNDQTTINKQLKQLSDFPELQKLYEFMTINIKNKYNKQ